jgi:cell wall-associated NlpC family hydrolase
MNARASPHLPSRRDHLWRMGGIALGCGLVLSGCGTPGPVHPSAGTSGAPPDTRAPERPPFAGATPTQAHEILMRAMSLIGTPYRNGGASPATGFDCSGLVAFVFGEVTGLKLPRSAEEQARLGREVARHELSPGDLVFFDTLRRPFSHVGIYMADVRFVHAPSSNGVVRTENLQDRYWAPRWNGARRLLT